jgi:hypothetical protein
MAIRDGMGIDLDSARTETVVRKGRIKYVAAPSQPAPRRVVKIAVVLLVAVLLFGAIYYFYTQRDVPDTLRMSVGKSKYSPGEQVNVSVFLQNNGPRGHSYLLSTSQTFGLEIRNSTGGIVAEYLPNPEPGALQLSVGPGQSLRLGEFRWNQTFRVLEGENETWAQVPIGNYVIHAYFKGSADIAAEKRITIG